MLPGPEKWYLQIVELRRACFGSAGCNVTFEVRATYFGIDPIPADEKFRVLYSVTGAENEQSGYLTIHGTQVYGRQETVTVPVGSQLTIGVTDVIR